ncbi:MAG: ABC transporter substrate-binding protein [Bacteroidota bacterium]
MEVINVALDWTPNINHVGFFVALEKGFYRQQGLEVNLVSPAEDNYAITPAKKVELGQADFALCPMESVLSYRTKETPFDLKAVAAIYQEDLSAIVTLKQSGIEAPAQLDGKSYASYQARYEDEIVKQMIVNDGGAGTINVAYPSKLGIWETIEKGQYDATWIFLNWEGIQASGRGLEFNAFQMKDFQIPYSYSPVLVASESQVAKRMDAFSRFLLATKQGYLFTMDERKEAAEILSAHIAAQDQDIDLLATIDYSVGAFGNRDHWGEMKTENVQTYLEWIYSKGLESKTVTADELISHVLVEEITKS